MNHAGEGLLQAYVDGEVSGEEKASLVAHLETCHECGRELEELRGAASMFSGAMALLGEGISGEAEDAVLAGAGQNRSVQLSEARERILRAHKAANAQSAPAASRTAPAVSIGLGDRDAKVTPIHARRSVARFASGSLARAAALVLLVAGGAAAMIPGSPVRRWLSERIGSVTSPRTASAPSTTPTATTTPAPAPRVFVPGAEMSIAPSNGKVAIRVFAEAGKGVVMVHLVDADRATVQADSSAHDVAFRTAPGALEVRNLGTADASIQIPRSLNGAEIEVNGATFLVKEGATLRVTGPVVRRSETEIVFQTGS